MKTALALFTVGAILWCLFCVALGAAVAVLVSG